MSNNSSRVHYPSFPPFLSISKLYFALSTLAQPFRHWYAKSSLLWGITTGWCSEVGFLTSLHAPEFHSSSDVREPSSLHQAVRIHHTLATGSTNAIKRFVLCDSISRVSSPVAATHIAALCIATHASICRFFTQFAAISTFINICK